MLLGVEFGQKYYRLHMGGSWEQVYPLGADRPVAQLRQALHVPGQGGGVTGDVDDALRGHPGQDGGHLRGQALPGRVHTDHLGADALPGQLGGGLSRVTAEEADVVHAVPGGVGPGVLNGLGDDLRADDLGGPLGQRQGDRADAAVEVQDGLRSGEPGEVQSLSVQAFSLGPVDLEEGGDRQAEGHAAQGLLQKIPPPEGVVVRPQDHIGVPGVLVEHHPGQRGDSLAQPPDQLLGMGEGASIGHHTAQGLPGPVGADVQVADQAGAGRLLVGRDVEVLHPPQKGQTQGGDGLRLEEAVGHIQYVVASGAVVAHRRAPAARRHGELHLVAVAVGRLRAQQRGQVQPDPAHPLQGVGDALALGPQLLGIGEVPELTAAAPAKQRTVRLGTLRGGLQQLHPPAPGHVGAHLLQTDPPELPLGGEGDKDHPALQPGHPHSLRRISLNAEGVDRVFLPFCHCLLLHGRCPLCCLGVERAGTAAACVFL